MPESSKYLQRGGYWLENCSNLENKDEQGSLMLTKTIVSMSSIALSRHARFRNSQLYKQFLHGFKLRITL